MAEIIDGKAIAAKLRKEIAADAAALTAQGIIPGSGGGTGGRATRPARSMSA